MTSEMKRLEKGLKAQDRRKYILRLYVAGMTPRSIRAIENINKICKEHLNGRHALDIIDIYQQPALVEEQIIAAPTLIKKQPLPVRKFIGDMTNTKKILLGLDLIPKKAN